MTGEEKAIWNAAYAAAFMADWERQYKSCLEADERTGHRGYGERAVTPYDKACMVVSAEAAISRADLAVLRLRQWRAAGEPQTGAGIVIDEGRLRESMASAMSASGQDWALKDETGKVHGPWRVIGRVTGGNGARWQCRCEVCGALRVFYGYALRAGQASTCKHAGKVGSVMAPLLRAELSHKPDDPTVLVLRIEPRELISDMALAFLQHHLMEDLEPFKGLPMALAGERRPLPPGVVSLQELTEICQRRLDGWRADGTLVWTPGRWRVVL